MQHLNFLVFRAPPSKMCGLSRHQSRQKALQPPVWRLRLDSSPGEGCAQALRAKRGTEGLSLSSAPHGSFPRSVHKCRSPCTGTALLGGHLPSGISVLRGGFHMGHTSQLRTGQLSPLRSPPRPQIHPPSFLVLLCVSGAGPGGCTPSGSSEGDSSGCLRTTVPTGRPLPRPTGLY